MKIMPTTYDSKTINKIMTSHINFGNAILEALVFRSADNLDSHNIKAGDHKQCILGKWIKASMNDGLSSDNMDQLNNKHISYHTIANLIVNEIKSAGDGFIISKESFQLLIQAQDSLTEALNSVSDELRECEEPAKASDI